MVSVIVNIPEEALKKVKNINYSTIADAQRVAQSLKDSGTVTQGDIVISLDKVDTLDPSFTPPFPGALPLFIDFSISMDWVNELGRHVIKMIPFHEIAGELVFHLESKPQGTWKPTIEIGSNPPTGDMERQ